MSRRLVYIAFGAAVGVLVVRKATQAAIRFTPAGVQASLAGSFSGLTEAIRDFSGDLREAMAEREDELRLSLGLDGTHDGVHTFDHNGTRDSVHTDVHIVAEPGESGPAAP